MSLGICFIKDKSAFLVTDRAATVLSENGENTSKMFIKNKIFKLGDVYFSVMGVEPLVSWVLEEINTLPNFNVKKIQDICKVKEKTFWNNLDDNLKNASWLQNGKVALLGVLWASSKPEIGIMSSEEAYETKIHYDSGKLLCKSAIKPDTMLHIIQRNFQIGGDIESVFSNIFKEANCIESAISKEFDFAYASQKISCLTSSKLTAGTIDAEEIDVININADNIKTGTLTSVKIEVTTDVTIGNKLYLGDSTEKVEKGIIFCNDLKSIKRMKQISLICLE